MSFNKYFQDELTALRELGREFSARNPNLAPFLGTPSRDPDVERLLEGFAFISGRLNQKLDDEYPELTHSLMQLLWPNYMRPVPSACVLQFTPGEKIAARMTIPRGVTVDSLPVEDTACRFRTTYATTVYPMVLSRIQGAEQGMDYLLRLSFDSRVPLDQLDLLDIVLHLSGEQHITRGIYYHCLRELTAIVLDVEGEEGRRIPLLRLTPDALEPMGFRPEESLLQYPKNSFTGYRHIQEYFCFRDKFMFLKLRGLDGIYTAKEHETALKQRTQFDIVLHFKKHMDPRMEPKLHNLLLYCTPVVNIFPCDCAPIRMDNRKTEYRIVPNPKKPDHYAVYAVEEVVGWQHGGQGRRRYTPFESFEHADTNGEVTGECYYRLRIMPGMQTQSLETYISFVSRHAELTTPEVETISLDVLCTNQNLPQRLKVHDICIATENTPESVTFRNITAVTDSYPPALDHGLHWRLISNMSLNYLSLSSVEALRTILSTYDFRAYHDVYYERMTAQLLSGLTDISHERVDRLYKGLPIRGIRTVLTVDETLFPSEGEMLLFCSVINEFFALYASINSFHELVVKTSRNGESYQWPTRIGQQPLL